MKDPMKSIPFLPKNVPGVGCVMQGWGGVCHIGWGGVCHAGGGVCHVGVGWSV